MTTDCVSRTRTIVVGVDGTHSSVVALRVAASLVPLAGTAIHAVSAWQWPLVTGLHTPPDQDYEGLAARTMSRALAEAFPDGAPCSVLRTVVRGLPSETLIEHSKDASIVLVGFHDHKSPVRYLSGPISSAVVEGALCPVLVCHGALQLTEDPLDSELAASRPESVPAP